MHTSYEYALTHSVNKQGLNSILVSRCMCSRDLQATNLFSCICLDLLADSYSHSLVMALLWLACLCSYSVIILSFFVSLLHGSEYCIYIPAVGFHFSFFRHSQCLLFSTASPTHTKFYPSDNIHS